MKENNVTNGISVIIKAYDSEKLHKIIVLKKRNFTV